MPGSVTRIALLALFLALIPRTPSAKEDRRSSDLPIVVFLRLASDSQTQRFEQQFATQLGLEIDGLEIEQVTLHEDEFLPLVLKEKLSKIQKLFKKEDIFSTLWIELGEEDEYLLNLVALSGNSAFVRVVSTPKGKSSAQDLAFSAQVLLQQTYTLSASGERKPAESLQGVLVKTVSMELHPEGQRASTMRFGLMPLFQMNISDSSSFQLFGGGLAVEGQVHNSFFFRFFAAVESGPSVKRPDGELSGWTMQMGLELGYIWTFSRLRLGPMAGVSPYRYALKIDLLDENTEELVRWDLVSTLGLDLRIVMTHHLELVLNAGLGIHGHTRDFKLATGETLLSIPRFDAQVALGILIAY